MHLLRDRDLALGRDLLQDQIHREERRQIVGPDRLPGARMKRRLGRVRRVGQHVVPAARDLALGQQNLGIGHRHCSLVR